MDELTKRRKLKEGTEFYNSLVKLGYNTKSKDMIELKQTLNSLR